MGGLLNEHDPHVPQSGHVGSSSGLITVVMTLISQLLGTAREIEICGNRTLPTNTEKIRQQCPAKYPSINQNL